MESSRTAVPSGWIKERFSDLASRPSKGQIRKAPKSIYQPKGTFPVVDQGQELVAGFVDDEEFLFRGQLPAIIFGDHTRTFKYLDFPFVVGADGTRIVTPLSDRVDVCFFFYALCNIPLTNLGYSRHFKLLKEQVVQFPESLGEQRKIAAILSSVDDAINKTQAVIEQVEVVRRSLTQKLLTRGLPGRHTRFKQTEIGEIPDEWEVRSVPSAVKKLSIGQRYDRRTRKEDGKIPIIDQSESGFFGYHDDEPGVLASPAVPVVTFANHTCAVRWHKSPFSVIQNVFPLIGGTAVRSRFVFHILRAAITPEGYKGHWPRLMETLIPVPTTEEQLLISAVIDSIEDRIESELRVIAGLSALKEALMSALLTGRLRVTLCPNFP